MCLMCYLFLVTSNFTNEFKSLTDLHKFSYLVRNEKKIFFILENHKLFTDCDKQLSRTHRRRQQLTLNKCVKISI